MSKREPVDRFCLVCQKRMERTERIEMGWSVTKGNIAVCSEKCRRRYNDPFTRGTDGKR